MKYLVVSKLFSTFVAKLVDIVLDMKKILIIVLCLIYGMGVWAQAEEKRNFKVIMGMNNLTYNKPEDKGTLAKVLDALLTGEVSKDQSKYKDAVRAAIVKGLSQSHRIIAIDGQLSKDDAALPNAMYIDGTVSNLSTTSKTENYESDGKTRYRTYYKALIGVTLHFKDAKTDEVFASPAFNLSQWDVSWIETQEGAMMKALEKLSSTITDYCNKWLPLSANVLEGARDKKDKQKEVYIDLGSKEGAYEGLHMGVYTVKTIAGKEAKKQIGRLKIMEVLGDDISLCKVQSGGKDIKAALDAGETLVIQTTD